MRTVSILFNKYSDKLILISFIFVKKIKKIFYNQYTDRRKI